MLKLLERLQSLAADKQRESVAGFQELVEAVAGGQEPPDDEALAILERTGKTPADLAAAVELFARRRELVAVIDGERDVRAAQVELEREISEAAERFRKQAERHNQEQAARIERQYELARRLSAVDNARRQLDETAGDRWPELVAEHAAIGKQLTENQRKIQSTRDHLERAEDAARTARRMAGDTDKLSNAFHELNPDARRSAASRADQADRQVKAHRTELVRLESERDELRARADSIRERWLLP